MRTVSTVEHLIKNKSGDIGGILLGDGTIVDTPPKHGDTLKAMIRRGDEVRVEGPAHRSRRGTIHVRARKIAMPTNRLYKHLDGAASPANPDMEAVGVVKRFRINRNGDVNGFELTDGIVVKTPSSQSEKILGHVKRGDEVRIEGRRAINRDGAVRLVAEKIHILHNGEVFQGRAGARMRQGTAPRNAAALAMGEAILIELREIRRLLDERPS